jgi:hypothetical protein
MEKFDMKEIFKQGLPGLGKHDQMVEKLGRKFLPQVFYHFVRYSLPYRSRIILRLKVTTSPLSGS